MTPEELYIEELEELAIDLARIVEDEFGATADIILDNRRTQGWMVGRSNEDLEKIRDYLIEELETRRQL